MRPDPAGPPPHVPVLRDEVLDWLQPRDGGLYVDGTLGLGGHTQAVLERSAPSGRVIGFEWDAEALARAQERLVPYRERLRIVHASYADLAGALEKLNVGPVDGLLVDLGVSSLQLDDRDRGFSFRADAPLDMRMDRRRPVTAAGLVARLSEEQLADLFYHYGEERQARRIARFLVEAREAEPVTTTGRLAEIVAAAVPRKFHPPRIHVATRVFQACASRSTPSWTTWRACWSRPRRCWPPAPGSPSLPFTRWKTGWSNRPLPATRHTGC